jgi:hypothetical protein
MEGLTLIAHSQWRRLRARELDRATKYMSTNTQCTTG